MNTFTTVSSEEYSTLRYGGGSIGRVSPLSLRGGILHVKDATLGPFEFPSVTVTPFSAEDTLVLDTSESLSLAGVVSLKSSDLGIWPLVNGDSDCFEFASFAAFRVEDTDCWPASWLRALFEESMMVTLCILLCSVESFAPLSTWVLEILSSTTPSREPFCRVRVESRPASESRTLWSASHRPSIQGSTATSSLDGKETKIKIKSARFRQTFGYDPPKIKSATVILLQCKENFFHKGYQW